MPNPNFELGLSIKSCHIWLWLYLFCYKALNWQQPNLQQQALSDSKCNDLLTHFECFLILNYNKQKEGMFAPICANLTNQFK